MKSAVINGALEGVTTGGTKWLGNVIENRIKARRVAKESSTARTAKSVAGKAGAAVKATEENSSMVRVGRWMCRDEYDKMISSGKVQMSSENMTHVANPADINAFGRQAPKGSIYVEFDVPKHTVAKGGSEVWGIIHGPGSVRDRLNARKGLPRITEMPNASNITIKGNK